MANFTALEQDISDALDDWAIRSQGILLAQKNPLLFIQVLRTKGLELVKLGDVQKIRHEQRVISDLVLQAYRELLAAKQRIELLQTGKDILNEEQEEKENG